MSTVDYTQLSNDELINRYYETKDFALRNMVLERFLYLAEIIAKKYVGRGVEYDDLYQIACMSLVGAIERFDAEKGVKFQSFATPTLVGEIKNYFRDKTRAIKITRKDSEEIKKMDVVRSELETKNGRSPRPAEIAEMMKVPVERVLELMEAKSVGYTMSLEGSLATSEDVSLEMIIGNDDESYNRVDNLDMLQHSLEHLSVLERTLVKIRFIEQKSQSMAAEKLGVSQMQVSRLERKVLLKLRSHLESDV
ncbi:MAG: sigma-70 family RNA polymerase sigma factor [Eubacteriales bacterium]